MRLAEVIFLTVEDVEDAHAVGIARAGGDLGVRDRNLVESAALAQSGYYDSFAELAAVLAFGLAKNHGLVDGNKRAAFLGVRDLASWAEARQFPAGFVAHYATPGSPPPRASRVPPPLSLRDLGITREKPLRHG